MVAPIPPELLGITGPGPAPGLPLNPGTPFPMPTAGPADMAGMVMGQLGAGGPGAPPPPGAPGLALGEPPSNGPPALSDDPILAGMLGQGASFPPFDPEEGLPDSQKRGYMPPLDHGTWMELANLDKERHTQLLQRFSRDLALYRQRISAKPPGFDPKREVAFKSATLSNIVNKLSNMCAPLDFRFNVPFKDETSKRNSQILENWYVYLRECEKIDYAQTGGTASLQWDEFFYLFLYGRICKRILPNPTKEHDPFDRELIDPATVFPVWGGSTEGLVRLTHRRPMTALDVIATYLPQNESLYDRMKSSIVEEFGIGSSEVNRFYHVERDFVEGYDSWNQWASWGDIEVYNKPHKLGYVPWVVVLAKGEPRGMTTPEGRYWNASWEDPDNPDEFTPVSEAEDLAQKGVSVFHHIVHTNRMSEMVYTLLFTQALSANNPATITYSAAQMAGNPPRPLNFKPGGNNQRTLNAQKVEIAPTSPRPSDVSPVLGKVSGDIAEGSINPAMYGQIEGSNIAGFAIESMIAAAKDTVLPYLGAFTTYQALCASMQAKQYDKRIAPFGIMAVPMEGKYGSSPAADLTPEVLRSAGHKVTVDIIGVSDQQLPMLVNAAGAAVERGFWSRRKAMEKLGEKDPSRMIQDIIIERALEHPEMMENFLIPINFIRSGQKDLADLWVLMVVMPKVQMLMQQMMGGQGGGAGGAMAGLAAAGASPPGGGGGNPMEALMGGMGGGQGGPAMLGPGAGPEANGQSNPMAGRDRGRPTGPGIGQGRGPAPAPAY